MIVKQGVISLGEALIDFIPKDETNTTYYKSPGGAPANVAVGIARLGGKSAFLGKVGDDVLGRFLQDTLTNCGVDVKQMKFISDIRTGVVFVTNTENGEGSFDFYINPSADRYLETTDINETAFKHCKIFHFGSISLIANPVKKTTEHAVKLAKDNGMIISYDPNLRLMLWETEEDARTTIISMLGQTDVLKLSEEELTFITGESSVDSGVSKLSQYNIPLIIVTLGANGCYVFTSDGHEHVPAMKVNAVDTTGAGDAFVSGILFALNKYVGNIRELQLQEAIKMAKFAAVSGALAAATKGAMTALPTLPEVEKYLDIDG